METITDANEIIITNAVMPVLPVCQSGNFLINPENWITC